MADDSVWMREFAALLLSRTGQVTTVSDGVEALDAMHRQPAPLLLADLNMPRLGGVELCRAVKQDPELAATRVVVLVSAPHGAGRAAALLAGADDVLNKPLDRVELLDIARRQLTPQAPTGLPRVPMEAPVHLRHDNRSWQGTARNLSRGGLFVESRHGVPLRTELAVELRLPESDTWLSTTAHVVWQRARSRAALGGMGLRFLSLEIPQLRLLADYVGERIHATPVLEMAS